jgi:uncharacterized membrane protein YbhN (UPF0104 family)
LISKTIQVQREAPAEPEAAERSDRRRVLRGVAGYVVKALLGLGLLAFVISRIHNRGALWHILRREQPAYFLLALVIYLFGQMVASARWRYLSSMLGLMGRYVDFVLFFFIGAFTNLFVPGLVGGDATRALYLGRRYHDLGRAIASVLADRLLGLLVLVWVATLAVAFLNHGSFPPEITTVILLLGSGSLAGYLLMPLVGRLARFLPARLRATVEMLKPYLYGQVAMLPAVALAATLHLLQITCQFVLALGLGLPLSYRLFLLCVPVTNLFTSLPITLGGLGIREGLYVVLFGMLGVGKADATALGLLWFALATLGGLCDSLAFIVAPAPLKAQAPHKSPALAEAE